MSETNLYTASAQWSSRPADQRFWSLKEMFDACQAHRDSSRTATVPFRSLRVQPGNGANLELVGQSGQSALITHYSFGQLCGQVGAPADYLRRLPAAMAAQNLNHGLAQLDAGDDANLLFHRNGSLVLRAATTDSYSRLWNSDVCRALAPFLREGWRVPPARPVSKDAPRARKATEADVLYARAGGGGLAINVGDMIAPAGLYASDRDMFAFLVRDDRRIDDGTEGGLGRGFFLSNSEVGDAAVKLTSFLYRYVCGNHIVWGAQQVTEWRYNHVGDIQAKFGEMLAEVRRLADLGAAQDEAVIANARKLRLGATLDDVTNVLYSRLRGDVSQKNMRAALAVAVTSAEQDATLDPFTVWGVVQGFTSYSQRLSYAGDRNAMDRAAGTLMALAV
jgi:hypothetical protein